MAVRAVELSPQRYARTGGWLYLIIIATGIFAELFVRDQLVVSGDASATARNILGAEFLWRLGFAAEMIELVCAVALTLIFYELLRRVNGSIALLSVFFNLVSIAVQSVCALSSIAALTLAPNSSDLALFSIRLYDYGFGVSLVFFGFVLLLLGYLVFESGYFPKFLGVLLPIGGACYIVNSFALFLSSRVEHAIYPFILVPSFIAELSFCLWLIVMGVSVPKWRALSPG